MFQTSGVDRVGSPMQCRPVLVPTLNAARGIVQPFLLDSLAVVEIELALDDLPSFRIDAGSVALAHGVGAVPAVLRRILLGAGGEHISILGARELPRGAHPLVGKL